MTMTKETTNKPPAAQTKPAPQPVASAIKIQSPRLITHSKTASRLMNEQNHSDNHSRNYWGTRNAVK